VRVIACEQGSPEWLAARLGVPSASEFDSIITPKKGDLAAAHETYIDRLIDESIRVDAKRKFQGNADTDRGHDLEPEARELYAFMHDVEPQTVGFVLRDSGDAGCSPDSLIGNRGGLEIKCPDGPQHVGYLRAGTLPDKYKPQVHGNLLITGCDWWDFMSYCPGHKPLIVRVAPDAFTGKLAVHLDFFVKKLAIEKLKIMKESA
jgi:hypothetical protein